MRMEPEPGAQAAGGSSAAAERIVWEFLNVSLNRVPGYGFGIAVSGGRDNPHFLKGDPSIAISDVLKAGPAEGRLRVNDRVLSANGISLENVDYARAVQVLRDSGSVVHLHVKRRLALPPTTQPQQLKMTLIKAKRKDDFGLVLGCQLFVKELRGRPSVMERDVTLQEGDVVLRINQQPAEGLTLKDARKLLDAARERLSLTVRRDPVPAGHPEKEDLAPSNQHGRSPSDARPGYGGDRGQNLYVPPPSHVHRGSHRHSDEKNNLIRQNGRSRGPLMDISLTQLDQPATPLLHAPEEQPPPRPPPPRDAVDDGLTNGPVGAHPTSNSVSDVYDENRLSYDRQSPRPKEPAPDPRFVSFMKEGSVGIRLAGGNETGVYVTAVQAGSPAAAQGLQPGDQIIKVNGMDMKGVTREEAVLYLLSLQDRIDLIVQYKKADYEQLMANQQGDSFYIRTHFNYEQANKNELSFRKGDIFHVVDTLNLGVVGSWLVNRIGRNNEATQKGVIPNKSAAEELATAQFNAAKKESAFSQTRSRLFSRRRRRPRSKSLGKDHWEDLVFSDAVSKFPAYERVTLRAAGFTRPLVLFGAVADLARERLLRDLPDRLEAPQLDSGAQSSKSKSSGIIRLSAIRELVARGRHALLDVTPNAVERLNYAQLYPICMLLRAENKQVLKQVRATSNTDRSQHKSSKKTIEQCAKLEKQWSHLFTATVTIADAESWYRKVKELVDRQQSAPIWMSETKPGESLSDDFLFPMAARLSYASAPDSELEGGGGAVVRAAAVSDPQLLRSVSDPSLTADDGPPPPYTPHQEAPRSLSQRHSHGGDSRYGFSPSRYTSEGLQAPPGSPPQHSPLEPRRRHTVSRPPATGQSSSRHGASPPEHLGRVSLPGPAAPSLRPGGQQVFSPPRHSLPDHLSPTSSPPPHGALPEPFSPPPHGALPDPFSPPPHGALPDPFSPPPRGSPQRLGLPTSSATLGQRSSLPEAPPRIDRSNKPALTGTRSYGRASGGQVRNQLDREDNYLSNSRNYTLDRLKSQSAYESGSSFDSFGRFGGTQDDVKVPCRPSEVGYLPRPQEGPPRNHASHDPYRFTRSTAQPLEHPPSSRHISRNDYKPMPPPKNTSYRPAPPPKPKNSRGAPPPPAEPYRHLRGPPPDSGGGGGGLDSPVRRTGGGGLDSPVRRTPDWRESREELAGGFPPLSSHDDAGGFDSGHGSSLDRNYDVTGRTYINMKPTGYCGGGPAVREGAGSQPGGLDLANRDQRGSAFELYRKPADPRFPCVEHGAR